MIQYCFALYEIIIEELDAKENKSKSKNDNFMRDVSDNSRCLVIKGAWVRFLVGHKWFVVYV